MFLSGLMFGSVIIFLLCHKEHVLDTQLSVEASAGIGLGIGLLCGLVTMLVRSVGLFMTGLLLGLLLALAALLVTQQFYTPTSVWVPLGTLLGAGMLFAVLTLQWQKLFTILSTAMFGAAIMTVCADYFVEMLVLATHVYECLRLTPGPPLCWYSWVILGIWPTLTLIGALVQWKLTDGSFSHTEGNKLQPRELIATQLYSWLIFDSVLFACSCHQSKTEKSPADADSREGCQEASAGRWAGRHVPP